MLTRALRLTENLAVLSLLASSALALRLTAARSSHRRVALAGAGWPSGEAE